MNQLSLAVFSHGTNCLEDELGHQFTGRFSRQVYRAVYVLQQALLHGSGSHVDGPVCAGELVVLVITHSAQDHGQNLIASDVLIGPEGVIFEALDVLCVTAVVDVTSVPVVCVHVSENLSAGIDVGLLVLHVAGCHAIDHRGHLGTSDGLLRLEGVIFIAVDDAHTGQNFCRLAILRGDVFRVGEGHRPSAHDHDRQQHSHAKHQAQNLLLGKPLRPQAPPSIFPTGFPLGSHGILQGESAGLCPSSRAKAGRERAQFVLHRRTTNAKKDLRR